MLEALSVAVSLIVYCPFTSGEIVVEVVVGVEKVIVPPEGPDCWLHWVVEMSEPTPACAGRSVAVPCWVNGTDSCLSDPAETVGGVLSNLIRPAELVVSVFETKSTLAYLKYWDWSVEMVIGAV